jgi:1,2-phenylacetyl-CoA epoxidase catalytic subunit
LTQDEIIAMLRASCDKDKVDPEQNGFWVIHTPELEAFAALVEKAVREKINDEAKAHLQELRNNFDVESTELRLHQWTRGQA